MDTVKVAPIHACCLINCGVNYNEQEPSKMSYERVKTFQRLIRENRKKNRAHTQELNLTYDQ